jgi:hypothetical protein
VIYCSVSRRINASCLLRVRSPTTPHNAAPMSTEQVDNPLDTVVDAEAPRGDLPAPGGAEEAAGDEASAADGILADVAAK